MEASSSTFNSEAKKILRFLGLLLFVLALADRLLGAGLGILQNRIVSGSTGGKLNYISTMEPRPQLLVMGSSRAHRHVRPSLFPIPAFNLAHSGMELPFHYGLLSIMEANNSLPETILLHVDPEYFVRQQTRTRRLEDIFFLSPYYSRSPEVKELIDSMGWTEKLKSTSHLYHFNGELLGLLRNTASPRAFADGGYRSTPASDEDGERLDYTLGIQASPSLPAPDPSATELLQKSLEICKRNGVALICFTSPTFYPAPESHAPARQFLKELFSEHKVTYLDYQRHQPGEVQARELWFDANHLNDNGAKIFTEILVRDLETAGVEI